MQVQFQAIQPMSLSQFAGAIADQSVIVLHHQTVLRTAQAKLDALTSEIEIEVAFGEFKNEAQRKARKLQLMQAGDIVKAQAAVNVAHDNLEIVKVHHAKLLNEFAALKLEMRLRCAQLESIAA